MSMSNGETAMRDAMKNLSDDANYQRLEKDVTSVKNDIAALTDQITDALNSFAGAAKKQARRGYKEARAHVDSALDDASDRGGAMLSAEANASAALLMYGCGKSPITIVPAAAITSAATSAGRVRSATGSTPPSRA